MNLYNVVSSSFFTEPQNNFLIGKAPLFENKDWSVSNGRSQNYQARYNVVHIIGPPAKRLLNGVSLVNRWWLRFDGILILFPLYLKNGCQSKTPLTKRSDWSTHDVFQDGDMFFSIKWKLKKKTKSRSAIHAKNSYVLQSIY